MLRICTWVKRLAKMPSVTMEHTRYCNLYLQPTGSVHLYYEVRIFDTATSCDELANGLVAIHWWYRRGMSERVLVYIVSCTMLTKAVDYVDLV
jgi:hypothetical protein